MMNKMMMMATFLICTSAYAEISTIEKMVTKKVTETYLLINGAYKRSAINIDGKERIITTIEGQTQIQDDFVYPSRPKLFEDKILTIGSNSISITMIIPENDNFERQENHLTFPADIKYKNKKLLKISIDGKMLASMKKKTTEMQLKELFLLSLKNGDIEESDIVVEKMKVKLSDITCLPKNNKLYCQSYLKLHAVLSLNK